MARIQGLDFSHMTLSLHMYNRSCQHTLIKAIQTVWYRCAHYSVFWGGIIGPMGDEENLIF